MTAYPAAAFLILAAAAPMAAQAPGDAKPSAMTMSGCVAAGQQPQAPITFADGENGNRYRLNGRGLKKYAGQRVEIIGRLDTPKKLTFKGGLYPSPNVAARAGALDPARAAIATLPGGPETGVGTDELLPELRVSRVRVLEGSCR